MDFSSLKRRELQSLCKKNNIPANTTNAAMADALASLHIVEGLDEFLGVTESQVKESPERSVITSPNVPRTTTRQKALKEELECSKMATRTRCGTRTRAVEGTDMRKTPATRTTRKRACQEASIKKKMEKDLQAKFEIDLEESEIVPGGELQEISEENSEVTVETEGHKLTESPIESQNEVDQVDDGQEVIDGYGSKDTQEEEHVVNEVQEEPVEMINDSKKVDFHSLSRKDLQNLCKKNKIPANTTNAAMADALESLEIVEGLQEFMENCGSQALRSPPMRGITSSCARRSWTTLKSTKEEPQSSKLITKSCRGSRRRILEETEQELNDVPDTPAAPPSTLPNDTQAGSALYDSGSVKEDNIANMGEQNKLNSSVADRECVASFSNCELESLETFEVSGGAEFNSHISILNVENLKEGGEIVSKIDENAVEEVIVESSEDAKFFTNNLSTEALDKWDTKHDQIIVSGDDDGLENTEVNKLSNLQIDAGSESKISQLENMVTAPDSAAEDQISKDVVCTTLSDPTLSSKSNAESNLGKREFEKVVTFTSDAAAHMERDEGSNQDELPDKSEIDPTIQATKPSPEINMENESEGSCTEDASEMSDYESLSESEDSCTEEETREKSVTESPSSLKPNVDSDSDDSCAEDEQFDSDNQVSLEINVDTETEKNKLERQDTTTDSAIEDQFNVDLESEKNQLQELDTITDSTTDGYAENVFSSMLDIESINQVRAHTENRTPLVHKSLRKLKRIYKEKLEEKKIQAEKLAKRMENLTLEEVQIPVAEVEGGVPVESECDSSHGVSPTELSGGNEEALVPATILDKKPDEEESDKASNAGMEQKDVGLSNDHQTDDSSENVVADSAVDTATLFPVDILQDNEEVSEDAVTGSISAVVTCPPPSTPSKLSTKKPLLFTSPTKTPKTAGRKNCVFDVNKENIDRSAASKTEPGKIKIAVTESGKLLSSMSMRSLKKEFKDLQQHSERKKALQSRSENLLN